MAENGKNVFNYIAEYAKKTKIKKQSIRDNYHHIDKDRQTPIALKP